MRSELIADGVGSVLMMLALIITHFLVDKGIKAMNAISRVTYTDDSEQFARTSARTSEAAMGLGPNQLTWLRRNIDSFKYAEDQRRQMRQDAVRAARIAGLV